MSSKQTQKGSRFEHKIRDLLRTKTGAQWERTPGSGAGVIKGDLFCPKTFYFHAFECKSFKDSIIKENLLSAKSNNFYSWWEQCVREAKEMNKIPALVFKMDRGKPLIAIEEKIIGINCLALESDLGNEYANVNIYLFEEWLETKEIKDLVII